MAKKKDDEITFDLRNWKIWLIISLLLIVMVMLWIEKDFVFVEITPAPKEEFTCNCHCEVPTYQEPINWSNIKWNEHD